MRVFQNLLLAGAALAALGGCQVNPVTGERELNLYTEEQEVELGREADEQIVAQYGAVGDRALVAYVDGVGRRLAEVSHMPDLEFTFRVLDDPVVNAFALPGGFVYLTRGILPYLQSEAAMAGVLGHEVGHVTARHGTRRMSQQTLLGAAIGVPALFSDTFADFAGILGGAAQLLVLKYSRDQERQSDELGVTYATEVGYDTTDMAEFFRTLDRLSPAGGGLPSFLSTHPDPGERSETVRALTRERQAELGAGRYLVGRDAFLDAIEGVVVGPDPRQGFVDGDRFRHPELKVEFPIPAEWTVQNSASQVALIAPGEEAFCLFGISDAASPAAAAQAFSEREGVQLEERTDLEVGGRPAARTRTRLRGEEGDARVVSTWVARGGRVYVFHGVAAADAFAGWRATLVQPADGLRELTDPAALAVQPAVLKVVAAPRAGPFRDVVADWPVPDGAGLDVERLAYMNGLAAPADRVEAGRRLKVVVRSR